MLPAEPDAQPEPAALSEADTVVVEHAAVVEHTAVVEHAAASAAETQADPQAPMPVDASQLPPQPYLDPAAFFAQLQTESAAPAAPAKRRWPRLVLRYASALVVAGAVGVGTGYALTLPKRTDVPFLATPSDGRYTYPAMTRPEPPAGKPAPADNANDPQIHYDDLRQYLVAAPVGLTPTEDGWEPVTDFDASLSGTNLPDHLADEGLRHVARRGWRTLDGQHTVVELLQFPDRQSAYAMQGMLDTASQAHAGKARDVVPQLTVTSLGDYTFKTALRTFDEVDGMPGQRERRVVFESGDVVAIITTTAPAAVPDVPTEQVVLLQAQMLR